MMSGWRIKMARLVPLSQVLAAQMLTAVQSRGPTARQLMDVRGKAIPFLSVKIQSALMIVTVQVRLGVVGVDQLAQELGPTLNTKTFKDKNTLMDKHKDVS